MKPTVSDTKLRDAVQEELVGDPEIDARHISVTASDGAVTLGGHVATHHEKHAAVRAAERVDAVQVVADDIDVREPSLHERADDEIAQEIARVRALQVEIEDDSIAVQVRDGHVFLDGHIESASQREFIEATARRLTGVRAVSDRIRVTPDADSRRADIERRVQGAIALEGGPHAESVHVAIEGGVVRLSGRLASLSSLEKALYAAKAAPGVTAVESTVVIAP